METKALGILSSLSTVIQRVNDRSWSDSISWCAFHKNTIELDWGEGIPHNLLCLGAPHPHTTACKHHPVPPFPVYWWFHITVTSQFAFLDLGNETLSADEERGFNRSIWHNEGIHINFCKFQTTGIGRYLMSFLEHSFMSNVWKYSIPTYVR